MRTTLLADVESISPTVKSGSDQELVISPIGELFTADWKTRLMRAGCVYRFDVGTIAAGGEPTPVVGGGDGTVIDQDQPEFGVGVPAGYYLIPIDIKITGEVDMDADGEMAEAIVFLDLAANVPTDGTKTAVTPQNVLDGGAAFGGSAFTAATADITDPTVSEILDFEHIQGSENGTASNLVSNRLKLDYRPDYPQAFAGPCSLYGCWGGTAAVNGIATIVFACVPATYFPLA